MEFRQLRYFLAVAETLHFTKAAARLHIAQPPLSYHIKKLEEEVGVALFERDKRHVALTPAGQAFVGEAQRLLHQVDRALTTVRKIGKGFVGRLRIGFSNPFSYSAFPLLLQSFRKEFPEIRVDLEELITPVQMEQLERGLLDVGFVYEAKDPAGSILLHRTYSEPLLVALPSGHRLAARRSISLQDLKSEQFVFLPRPLGPGFYDLVMNACLDAKFMPSVTQEVNQLQTVANLVGAGMGISLIPACMQRLDPLRVTYRPLRKDQQPMATAAMAWRADASSPLRDHFVEFIRSSSWNPGKV